MYNIKINNLNKIPLLIIAVFFLILNLFSGCSGNKEKNDKKNYLRKNKDAKPAYGDSIVVASIGDASTLVPILASDSASQEIVSLVFNGLVKYDKDIKLVGDLAERWEIKESGLVIIFFLRKDVLWHDGYPFTAKDVKFTYEKLIDPMVRTPFSSDFTRIKKIEVIDDYKIKITYNHPFSPALDSWTMWIMPEHLLKNEDINKTNFSRHPIGTGPYIFKKWQTGQLIELEANPKYFEGSPYIKKYIYRIIPDHATLFLELMTLGVDYTGLTPLQYRRQTNTGFFKTNFQKFQYPSFGYTYIGYNLKNEKFKDIRVRWAFNYAINKEEIIDGVLMGLGRVCTGPFVPESWAYNKEIKAAEYNPKEALRLLKQAGWIDSNNDGILDKDGEKFEFTLITNQGNESRRMVAEIVQKRLKEVGVNMKIKIIEWNAFINEFINKRNFEAVLLGWGLSRDPDCYDIWNSSKTGEGEFNFVSYSNPEVDRLLEQGRREFDRKKRAKIYKRIHRILYNDQPYTFLYVADSLPVVHSRFRGVKLESIGIGYNFIKWYVPKEEQRYTR